MGTVVVGAALLIIVGAVIYGMIRDKKIRQVITMWLRLQKLRSSLWTINENPVVNDRCKKCHNPKKTVAGKLPDGFLV